VCPAAKSPRDNAAVDADHVHSPMTTNAGKVKPAWWTYEASPMDAGPWAGRMLASGSMPPPRELHRRDTPGQ
jgi:hypothetical protein